MVELGVGGGVALVDTTGINYSILIITFHFLFLVIREFLLQFKKDLLLQGVV